MKKFILLIIILVPILLAACQPDPRRAAQADAIRSDAAIKAANEAAQRQAQQDLHGMEMQKLQLAQAHRLAVQQQYEDGLRMLNTWGWKALVISGCFLLFAIAYSIAKSSLGIANAIVRKADIQANLLHVDQRTGNFPAYLFQREDGRFMLIDPNTHTSMQLDVRYEGDAQMIAAAMTARQMAVLTAAAPKVADVASLSQIQPLLIETGDQTTSMIRQLREKNDEVHDE